MWDFELTVLIPSALIGRSAQEVGATAILILHECSSCVVVRRRYNIPSIKSYEHSPKSFPRACCTVLKLPVGFLKS